MSLESCLKVCIDLVAEIQFIDLLIDPALMETFSYPLSSIKMGCDYQAAKSWSRSTKRKNKSVSSHRRNGPYAVPPSEKSKKKVHTRQSSIIKKSKSKCETEVNYNSKKKSVENETLSKKTIKKKRVMEDSLRYSQNKLSSSKKQEEDIELKGRKKWPRKEMFHSTCFSRLMDPDIGSLGAFVHANSDVIQPQELKNSEQSLVTIVNRTRQVLNAYHKKCEDLTACCSYYKKELDKALKRIPTQRKDGSVQRKTHKRNSDGKRNIQKECKF